MKQGMYIFYSLEKSYLMDNLIKFIDASGLSERYRAGSTSI